MLKFSDYKLKIDAVECVRSITCFPAYMWLHPDRLPQQLIGIVVTDNVVKLPPVVKIKTSCPEIISISYKAFHPENEKEFNKIKDSITDIILPPTISSIEVGAFSNLVNLERIAIPKKVKIIKEKTFENCKNLSDIYFEGSKDDWEKLKIVNSKYCVDLTGELIPGTPVEKVINQRLEIIPGNEIISNCNIHFNCSFYDSYSPKGEFRIYVGNSNVTDLFEIKEN